MKDLDRVIEEYFKPSKKSSGLELTKLIQMVEEAMASPLVERDRRSTEVVKTTTQAAQTVEIALPFVQLSEAWGNPTSEQRKEIAQFVERMGVTASSSSPTETLRARLAQLQRFLDVLMGVKPADVPVSQLISNILLLDSLSAIATGGEEAQYSASPAGFLFEGFLAALAGGGSRQIPAAGAKTIADITINLGDDGAGVPVSLKLLKRKGGAVEGSIRDLSKSFVEKADINRQALVDMGFESGSPEEVMKFLMGLAEPLDEARPPMEPEAAYDPETGKVVPRSGRGTAPTIDDNISGMKYIIALKSPSKEGTRVQFYEFDFTYEKFKAWVSSGKIPAPGDPETQFSLNKTDYFFGPGGKGSGGGAVEIASLDLPSSKNVRLKAQEILKETYEDFYKILKTLKETTDHLNDYLSDPEDVSAGRTAAEDADTLEKSIIKTTGE
jgi:hypothetical protein